MQERHCMCVCRVFKAGTFGAVGKHKTRNVNAKNANTKQNLNKIN